MSIAGEGDGAEAITCALFNRHQDIDALSAVRPEGEPVQAAFVADLGARRFDGGVGVAFVAIGKANALSVFVELGGVEGAGEEIFKDDE